MFLNRESPVAQPAPAATLYQQGDLLLTRLPEGPSGPRRRRSDGVLLRGELTGHAHRVSGGGSVFEIDGTLYVDTEGNITVEHEEHKPVALGPGVYRVGRVREFDHLAREEDALRDLFVND
jgi:hypothetical protein